MEVNKIVVVGLGGIGGALVDPLCRFVQFSLKSDDPVPVLLVDGDLYEPKNLERQNMTWEDVRKNKAERHASRMKKMFETTEIKHRGDYITVENVGEIVEEGDVVLLGVDNHKTRKLVADHCGTLDNITLISGGNEYTDGNVQIFVKKNGEAVTANLGDFHPEIANPQDKHPDELSCEDALMVHPQLLIMNLQIATLMLIAFYNVTEAKDLSDLPFGEIYTDIATCETATATRKPVKAG